MATGEVPRLQGCEWRVLWALTDDWVPVREVAVKSGHTSNPKIQRRVFARQIRALHAMGLAEVSGEAGALLLRRTASGTEALHGFR
jgi:hypothetical protein